MPAKIDKFEAIKVLLSLLQHELSDYEISSSKVGGYADTVRLVLWNTGTSVTIQVLEATDTTLERLGLAA